MLYIGPYTPFLPPSDDMRPIGSLTLHPINQPTERAKLMVRWRSQFQSNELFTEINFVLARFSEPYGKLFAHVDTLLAGGQADPASIPLLGETLQLLIELLHDLNCQDLAPFFEENTVLFMGSEDGSQQGFLRKYLAWERAELKGDVSCRDRIGRAIMQADSTGRRRGARAASENSSGNMRDCRALGGEVFRYVPAIALLCGWRVEHVDNRQPGTEGGSGTSVPFQLGLRCAGRPGPGWQVDRAAGLARAQVLVGRRQDGHAEGHVCVT